MRRARSPSDWRQATGLLRDYATWVEAAIGVNLATAQPDFAAELADLRAAYASPGSTFLVADDGATVCGTVAVRRHADGTAELKRLYVHPSARRAGHADRLVRCAIDHATTSGATRMWLETLPGTMDPAIALYRRHGFAPATGADATIDITGVMVMARPVGRPSSLVGR